ncbi:hypothetical protein AAMO2058_001094700 [Amorphochlora amoebiformis]
MGWWDLNEVIEGLESFNATYGHVKVPAKFVVPSCEPWPIYCWKLSLGEHLNFLRKAQGRYLGPQADDAAERLQALGFEWEESAYSLKDFEMAWDTHYSTAKTVYIPLSFVVPPNPPWPLSAAGFELGREVSRLRRLRDRHPLLSSESEENSQKFLEKLQNLSFFPQNSRARRRTQRENKRSQDAQKSWENLLLALRTYYDLSGDLDVPYAYVVPSEDPWPLEVQGLPLGIRVQTIRSEKAHLTGPESAKRTELLNEMGFVWEMHEMKFEDIVDGLKQFKQIHAHLLVPQDFVVPPLSPWPEHLWGLKLGHRVNRIRNDAYIKGRPDRKKVLDDLGFEWDTRDVSWRVTLETLKLYKVLVTDKRESKKGKAAELRVPQTFIVPSQPPWPELAWGMQLGQRCSKIRLRGDFILENPSRIKELENLSFFWGRGKGPDGGRRFVTGYADLDWSLDDPHMSLDDLITTQQVSTDNIS